LGEHVRSRSAPGCASRARAPRGRLRRRREAAADRGAVSNCGSLHTRHRAAASGNGRPATAKRRSVARCLPLPCTSKRRRGRSPRRLSGCVLGGVRASRSAGISEFALGEVRKAAAQRPCAPDSQTGFERALTDAVGRALLGAVADADQKIDAVSAAAVRRRGRVRERANPTGALRAAYRPLALRSHPPGELDTFPAIGARASGESVKSTGGSTRR
jgi:hypothetical protein